MPRTNLASACASASRLLRRAIGTTVRIRPRGSMTKTIVVCAPPPTTPYECHTEARPVTGPDEPVGGPVKKSHRCAIECVWDHRRTSRTDVYLGLAFTATSSVSCDFVPSSSFVRSNSEAISGQMFVHRLETNVRSTPLPRKDEAR